MATHYITLLYLCFSNLIILFKKKDICLRTGLIITPLAGFFIPYWYILFCINLFILYFKLFNFKSDIKSLLLFIVIFIYLISNNNTFIFNNMIYFFINEFNINVSLTKI